MANNIYLVSALLIVSGQMAAAQLPDQDSPEHFGQGYTIINNVEIANADMTQTVNVNVRAMNIGQGLEIILRNTGWRLERGSGADPQLHRLLSGPWPDKWVWVGPDQLGNILQTVGGQGWQLVIDPVNRLISYERNPRLINNKNRSSQRRGG